MLAAQCRQVCQISTRIRSNAVLISLQRRERWTGNKTVVVQVIVFIGNTVYYLTTLAKHVCG